MSLYKVFSFVKRFKNNSLARETFWIMLAKIIRILIQAAYFIIIARALGVQQYGAFVGVIALVNIFVPFASWGSEHILVKNVSRDRSLFAEYWGNSLFLISIISSILLIFILLNFSTFIPSSISFLVIFFVAISDLVFSITLRTAIRAFQAVKLLHISAQLDIIQSSCRLIAAICLVAFFTQPGIIAWASLYMSGTIIATVIALFLVRHYLGRPKLAIKLIKPELIQGFYFSVSMSSQSINNHIDKTMLAKNSSLEATGIYAAAYRLIEVAMVPITSLIFASYPQFFKQGSKGIRHSVNFARKLLPTALFYSLIIGFTIFLFAPIVPYILGAEYSNAIEALRWLALLPFLKCIHTLAGNTLTGADLQGFRSAIQVSVALFNIVMNYWLIPLYSWKGAAWATLASDGLLAVGCWCIIAWYFWHPDQGGEIL